MSLINKVGIVGEGKMGTGIFYYLLEFPFELVWVCSEVADVEKLSRQFGKRIRRSLDAGIIDRAKHDRLLATPITTDANALKDCDLVIEAIPEEPGLKMKLFNRLDKIVKPGAIFTSNSSSINPSRLMPEPDNSRQIAGLHFFYPVPLKNIVEVTLASSTTIQTRVAIESFLDTIRRRFITLDEHNSFILNRIFLDFQNEAFLIVQEGGGSFIQMDQLVRKHFFPFGVFDFCDSVGLDTMLTSIENYTLNDPGKDKYAGFVSVIAGLVSAGKLGVKTQAGFYSYPLEESGTDLPLESPEIITRLHRTCLSACNEYTARSAVPHELMNEAIKEYFGIEKGPFA
jgi:3-hydroxyacyl-CoA dehydrogenase